MLDLSVAALSGNLVIVLLASLSLQSKSRFCPVCFATISNAWPLSSLIILLSPSLGRWLWGPDRPYHFVGSRKHTRNYQSFKLSFNCPLLLPSVLPICWTPVSTKLNQQCSLILIYKTVSCFAQSLTLSMGSWLTPKLSRIVLFMSFFRCSNLLNSIVSWERDPSNFSACKFNEILRFWPFLLSHGWITLIRI